MKNGSKRTVSRVLAFIMIVSSMFANVMIANAVEDTAAPDEVVSEAAAEAVVDEVESLSDAAGPFTYTPSADAEAGASLYSDNLADIEAVQNLTYNAATATLSDGTAVTGSVKTTSTNTTLIVDGGESKTFRLAFKVTAKADIVVKYAAKCNSGKGIYAVKVDDESAINKNKDASSTATSYVKEANSSGATTYNVQEFALKAGEVAYIAGQGTDAEFYGVGIEADVPVTLPELAKAEAGKTYTADFVAYANENGGDGDVDAGNTPAHSFKDVKFGDGTIVGVSKNDTFYSHDASHGAAIGAGDVIYVSVSGEAKITMAPCEYGSGTTYAVTNAETGEAVGEINAKSPTHEDGTAYTLDYYGPAAILAITSSSAGFLHKLEVANAAIIDGKATGFTLFLDDISYDVEGTNDAGEAIVTKTIDPQAYTGEIDLNTGEKLDLGDAKFELIGMGDTKFTNTLVSAIGNVDISRGGRDHVSGFKAGNRNADANNLPAVPKQGEGTAMVFTPVKSGMIIVYYATQANGICAIHEFNPDGTKTTGGNAGASFPGQYRAAAGQESYAIEVKAGCTYVMSTTGATNNLTFVGLKYAPNEPVNVQLADWKEDGKYNYDNVEVTFTDADLGTVAGTVKKGDTSITLMKGHNYALTTNDGGAKASIEDSTSFTVVDEGPVTIEMTEIPDTTLRGSIIGDTDAVRSVQSLSFVSMVSGVAFPAVINKDGTYEVEAIKPGEFNAVITTTGGFTTYDRAHVEADFDNVDDVYVESTVKSYYELSEEIGSANTALTFNTTNGKFNNNTSIAMYSGDSIVVPVEGKKLITVGGWYQAEWYIGEQDVPEHHGHATNDDKDTSCAEATYTTDGTETSVTIHFVDYAGDETQDGKSEGSTTSYLRYIKVEDASASEFRPEISIPRDYATLTEAVAGIKAMDRPEGEAGRVTITLNKDLQEQAVIDAPYVTLKGNGHEINWYYGVTGKYYSCDENGYYNERLFYDKYEKHEASGQLWGAVVIIRGDYFRAENVTFKNTFNYEVTPKEVEDGAESVGVGLRSLDTDVTVYSAKERSNAFYIEAKGIEAYKCNILSSQDTLGRNGSADSGYSAYFKDCVIGGNTDYICGEFAAVFDNCELQWKSYANDPSHNADGTTGVGYIVAPKTAPYIFRNCEVTTSGAEGNDPVIGNWGRTWGLNSQAYFINCETNGYIKSTDAWQEMNKDDHLTAKFGEFGNTNHGTLFTTDSAYASELTAAQVSEFLSDDVLNAYVFSDAGSEWTPYYYDAEVEPDVETEPGDVDEDGDIDVIDVSRTLQYTLTAKVSGKFNKKNAEVSGNNTIDSEDVALILQKVLDSTFVFPVLAPPTEATTEATTEESTGSEPVGTAKIFVVGDSTGCHYAETEDKGDYFKRVGYGDKIADYINADVVNYALSGRSSKSFVTEENYTKLQNELSEGDYLIIAFGHNDEKADDAARYTFPSTASNPTTKDTEGSFKNSLYVNYIKLAQDKGATPILCTPIVRRVTGDTWSNNSIHKANDGDYKQDVIDLAGEVGIDYIDLTTLTQNEYTKIGPGADGSYDPATKKMTLPTGTALLHRTYNNGAVDNTHLNNYGAKYVAYLFAEAVKASDSTLKSYVKDGNVAPTEADLIVSPDWAPPVSDDPTGDELISKFWKTTSPWFASAFGNIGGQGALQAEDTANPGSYLDELAKTGDVTNFWVGEDGNNINVRAGIPEANSTTSTKGKAVGKIEGDGKTDGLIAYYQPISADGNYEISGTITVNSYMKNSQVAFGAIISDNMKVDTNATENYKYVAAGGFRLSDIGADIKDKEGVVTGKNSGVASYARIDGKLNYGENARYYANDINPGDKIAVKIVKKGDTFTTTTQNLTQNLPAVTDTYTVSMEGTAYAGFFAARCADITIDKTTIVANNEVVE